MIGTRLKMYCRLSIGRASKNLPNSTSSRRANSASVGLDGASSVNNSRYTCLLRQTVLRSFSVLHPVDYHPFDRSMVEGEFGKYANEYDRSLRHPEQFWGDAAERIHWFEKPSKILSQDPERPYLYQWFSDGTTNTAYNCLDVHVHAGNGDRTAIIYDSPVTGTQAHFTYQQLLDKVSIFAGALKDDLGVEPGDRVVIYMPMIPEAIVAMVSHLCISIATLRRGLSHCPFPLS